MINLLVWIDLTTGPDLLNLQVISRLQAHPQFLICLSQMHNKSFLFTLLFDYLLIRGPTGKSVLNIKALQMKLKWDLIAFNYFCSQDCTDEIPCEGLDNHAHFKNFGFSMLTLFRVSTGDNWNGILKVFVFNTFHSIARTKIAPGLYLQVGWSDVDGTSIFSFPELPSLLE